MDMNWLESILYGLISGFSEILPVSSRAHGFLMLKLFGKSSEPALIRLMIDLGILAAVYYSCQNHIIRILRARRLASIPKRRRKRPLDTMSLMDLSLLKTLAIPVILVLIFYNKIQAISVKMLWIAVCLLINGLILYVPQFMAGGNRDSRTLSRLLGLVIGLGRAVGFVPGISGMGCGLSVSSVCTVDRKYALNMMLLLQLVVSIGYTVWNVLALVSVGLSGISFGTILCYFAAGIAAFGGTLGAVKVLRALAPNIGYALFAYYCWGLALFTFIMNLLA